MARAIIPLVNRRSSIFGAVSLSLLLLLACPSSIATAQGLGGPPVDQAELTRLSLLSQSEQRTPANQARLQRWFFLNSAAFQNGIRVTALGRSALVNVGPPSEPPGGAYARTFAPPAGRGKFVVLYTDVLNPSTHEGNSTVQFPRSLQPPPMNGKEPGTCWHESLHALMIGSPLSVRVEDFGTVQFYSGSGFYREAQEHIYIEAFAEKCAAWVAGLTGFERAAVAAAEQIEELKRLGRAVNFEVESFVWAGARAEWQICWENFGKNIPRLPPPIKDEFERGSYTRFPTVEEVIGFYMGGDFRAPAGTKRAGQPVKVPKWVMWPGPAAMPVLMEDRDRKGPELKAGVWTASFGVTFAEPRFRSHPVVTRGSVAVTLRSDDPTARIVVSYGGRTIPASNPAPGSSWRRFVVKLGGAPAGAVAAGTEPVQVTVSVKDSIRSASAREPVLPVHVFYRDDPPAGPGARPPARIYLDTEGVFLVKLAGGGSGSGGGPPPGPPAGVPSTPSPASKGRWVLRDSWTCLLYTSPSPRD